VPRGLGRFRTSRFPSWGTSGTPCWPRGIGKALAYARRHSIGHVVFLVDSTGGSVDEALLVYEKMKAYKKRLKFHAIVKNSVGPSIAVTAWCDTIHVKEGARMGGRRGGLDQLPEQYAQEDIAVVRGQLADKAARETGRSRRGQAFLRAMIDPEEELYAWKAGDRVKYSRRKPKEVGDDQVLVAVGEGVTLQLSYEQCIALGVPSLAGGAETLGKPFHLKGWAAESDYGKTIVKKTADRRRKRTKAKTAVFERKAERNLKRREEAQEYIDHKMRKAAAWDPTSASYETYKRKWHLGWGITGEVDTGELTDEAQHKWVKRTDGCIYYLLRAAKGLRSLRRLEQEAVKLGLEANHAPGEIDGMLKDIQQRLDALAKHRAKETNN